VAPTIPHHCSREFLPACLKLSKNHGTGLHSHVAESKVQVIAGYQVFGRSLTACMESLGLVGPDCTIAHGVWLDGGGMKLLGQSEHVREHAARLDGLQGAGTRSAELDLDGGSPRSRNGGHHHARHDS